MTKILSFLLLAFVFVGYQNCGKQVEFAMESDKVSINEGAEVGPIDDNDIVINDDDGEDQESDDIDDEVVENPVEDNDDDDSSNGKSKTGYICILEGNGKSQRLGYSDSQLIVNGSTPQTVCTTKRACLEIVSQKFNVVSAEYRGFCKNNSGHSVPLSESDLEALIH